MKVSDLMLDMATGDASWNDVNIQEAVGKINVSSTIFEAAYNISELPSKDIAYVQEAADAAGLPTDRDESIGVATEAVKRELTAFYDLIVATAKKIKSNAEKDMKAIIAIGKKYGIKSNTGNFLTEFINPLCTAIMNDNGGAIVLSDKRFIKAKYAARMTENYGRGLTNLMSGYGINIDNVYSDSVVEMIVRKSTGGAKRADLRDLRDLESNLSAGGKLINFDKTVEPNRHYTDTIKSNDIITVAISLYTIIKISDAIIKNTASASQKKTAIANLTSLCDTNTANGKRITRVCESINDGVKEWSDNLTNITNNITKAFTDSIYSLVEAITSQKAN